MSTLHRAGADAVLSYVSTGANAIGNVLTADTHFEPAEGLDVFRVPVPAELAGRAPTGAGAGVHRLHVVAISTAIVSVDPDAQVPLPASADLVLIGDGDSEDSFLRRYGDGPSHDRAIKRLEPRVEPRVAGHADPTTRSSSSSAATCLPTDRCHGGRRRPWVDLQGACTWGVR